MFCLSESIVSEAPADVLNDMEEINNAFLVVSGKIKVQLIAGINP